MQLIFIEKGKMIMKKLTALLLALMMVLCVGLTAYAAEPTGSITLKDSPTVPVAGKTFNAYKVMDATMIDPADPSKGVSYTVPAAMADFYAARYTVEKSAPDFNEKVVAGINAEEDLFVFARDILAAAKAAQIVPGTVTASSDAHQVTIDNLPLGYYVVEDVGAAAPISALILDTAGNVDVAIKADKPVIDKKIDGDTDTDPSTDGLVDTNTAAIGDKIPYKLTTKVPDMTGYRKYFFVVTDVLSAGLTCNNDVTVTIDGQSLSSEQYEVTFSTAESGETTVQIVFKDFIQHKASAGQPIVINYSATLNEKAVIGVEGNPNKVNLEYSNNPNTDAHGTPENPDIPGEDDVTGKTPDEVTKTFVTDLELIKVNEQDQRLTGAEFELSGTRLNTVLITREVFTQSPDGTWYLLKDGTYTEQQPSDKTAGQYESTEIKYVKETKTETVEHSDHVHYKGTVGSDGVLRFTGLAAGEYEITELKAPNGYNLLKEPIRVVIRCQLPGDASGNCVWEVDEPAAASETGLITLKVVNKTGTELPSTGGIGTTVFYVLGAVLILGAGVLLIVRKRMASGR